MTQDTVVVAVNYYMNGINFRVSAERLASELELDEHGRPTKLTAIPLYFLASHAAELFLKAALLKRGFQEVDLKKFDYRHNLSALLIEVQSKGIPVTNDTAAVVNGLSEQHQSHRLRYNPIFGDEGEKIYWPPLYLLFTALEELLLLTRLSTHGI